MSQQILCDGCGEPIDQSVSYYSASIATVQMVDGTLIAGASPLQRDYHADHLPQNIDPSVADD